MRYDFIERIETKLRPMFTNGAIAAPLVSAGPVGWVALGLATLAQGIILFHGKAHLVANDITKPNEGPQWIWEHQTLPALIDPLAFKKASGTMTREDVVTVMQGLESARQQVLDSIARFGAAIAAINARKTVNEVTDKLLADRRAELEAFQVQANVTEKDLVGVGMVLIVMLLVLVLLFRPKKR